MQPKLGLALRVDALSVAGSMEDSGAGCLPDGSRVRRDCCLLPQFDCAAVVGFEAQLGRKSIYKEA